MDPANAIYRYDAALAAANYTASPASRWDNTFQAARDDKPTSVSQRDQWRFEPLLTEGIRISPDDRVFAIGSCFARNVEAALHQRGIHVASRTDAFDSSIVETAGANPIGYTNKYNPLAILNELGWALDASCVFPAEALLPLDDGTWLDPHAHPVLVRGNYDVTWERRQVLLDLTRQVRNCRIIVITLGLIEAWRDMDTGLWTNVTPPLRAPYWGRFELTILSFSLVYAALEKISELLERFCRPDIEIIVTVSPVPLAATFSGRDIVVANTHSKALLRAAAEEWASAHSNVSYFPSFEIIMNSDRDWAWEDDWRHVRWEAVQHVMDVFVRTHLETAVAQA